MQYFNAYNEFPDAYYKTYEVSVADFDDFGLRCDQVNALARRNGLTFYWRGQADAGWGVHSSLHRAIALDRNLDVSAVDDREVVAVEREIVMTAREWIRPSIGARLATIDLLARLQHHGVPTRLIDFSKNPLVALFFATMTHDGVDGRVVVAAARDKAKEAFRDSFDIPWARGMRTRPKGWGNTLVALEDHEDFLRISRQKGVFLTGGTPSTGIQRRLDDGSLMGAQAVRASMSIPLALHSWVQAEAALTGRSVRGRKPTMASALTILVPAHVKLGFRKLLAEKECVYSRLFPDVGGFLAYSDVMKDLRSVASTRMGPR